MVKVLVTEYTKKLNVFPSKHDESSYYSPSMILHQRNLDYLKHCQYAFGTYVQAHDGRNLSTNIRTLDYF
jgi:hypothetical protein